MAPTAVERNSQAAIEAERNFSDQAADLAASIGSSIRTRSLSPMNQSFRAKLGLDYVARRTLGICLLLVTVLLWTLSNFLASVSQYLLSELKSTVSKYSTVHLLGSYI